MGISVLLDRLEATWAEPEGASLEQVTRVLAERQRILAELQEADVSALSPETRQELAERLRRVRERDMRLHTALANQRQRLEKELDGVLHARSAARSYRAADAPADKGPERVA